MAKQNPSFAERFLTGEVIVPDDQRIFHRAGYQYDDAVRLGKASLSNNLLMVDVHLTSKRTGHLFIEPVNNHTLRIRFGLPGSLYDDSSPMLMALTEEKPQVTWREENGSDRRKLTCTFNGYRLELDHSPFCFRVISPQNEVIFESETERLVDLFTSSPLGLRRKLNPDSHVSRPEFECAFLSWRIRNQDRCFGLGEKFNKFEKTGTRTTIWQADTCGSNTSDMSYKAVPVVFSTAGWALVLHSAFRSYWELGSFSYATGALMVEEPQLDLYLILAPTLKEQVTNYTCLTGRPSMPPRWAFGVWMSRAAYLNRNQMWEVAERLRSESIHCDTFNIDPTYLGQSYYNEIGVEVCNFTWNKNDWGNPEDVFIQFGGLGFGICLWINPYLSEDSMLYSEAKQKGYLVRTTDGRIARLEFGLAAAIVDLTNPEAKTWWQAHLADLLEKGASVFKADFGDRVPENALFSNGKTGREMHNLFVHLYVQAVYEVTRRVKGTGIVWRRPGYIGSQRFPGCWAGDTQTTWEGMAGALRGGLSTAFSGDSFWSHDIGGFVGPQPSEELYIRWSQFGLLSPFARFHGTTPREPWMFGKQALEVVREYSRLRYSLAPYLFAYGNESTQSGLPMMRPMVLEFPDEPRIDAIDDQYMLGPDLLVAPVFQPGLTSRPIYLPAGQWWAFERNGSTAAGPGYHYADAPLNKIPLFARAGAVIPRYKRPPYHLKGSTPKDWLLDIYPGDSQRHLTIPEKSFTLNIDYSCKKGVSLLGISPAPITLDVRLVDRRPIFVRAGDINLQPGSGGATFQVDVSRGVRIEFKV